MTMSPVIRKAVSRAAANLVAVVAITAIFGLKAYINDQAGATALAAEPPSSLAAYEPYLTEQP